MSYEFKNELGTILSSVHEINTKRTPLAVRHRVVKGVNFLRASVDSLHTAPLAILAACR
jgi:hypothetical protein